jgi:hypothetical protein
MRGNNQFPVRLRGCLAGAARLDCIHVPADRRFSNLRREVGRGDLLRGFLESSAQSSIVKEPGALLKANGFVPADYGRFLRSERRPIIKKPEKQYPGAKEYTKHSSHAFAPIPSVM